MPVTDVHSRNATAWRAATQHPFLVAVRDGTVRPAAFAAWLGQDHRFVCDLLAFQARLLARAPRYTQSVLANGAVALVDELAWFEQQAATRRIDLAAPARAATADYARLLGRLDQVAVEVALTALWAIERVYLDAWSFAAPGALAYREFVTHWTTPEFAAYVDALGEAADAALAGSTPPDLHAVLGEVLAAETRFWDMALEIPDIGSNLT